MLQGKFAGQYRKRSTQRMVFKYTVIGPEAEVKAYEQVQGDNLVHDDDGKPLLFAITPGVGNTVNIIQTGGFNGAPVQYRIDNSALDRAAALAEQYGNSIFGRVIAEQAMAGLNLNFSVSTTNTGGVGVGVGDGGLGGEAGDKE